VTLSNTSTAPLNFAGVAVSITGASDFAITGTSCGGTLLAGTSCNVGLVFTPAALGSRSAGLVFSDTAANSPQTVALSGTGTAAANGSVPTKPASAAPSAAPALPSSVIFSNQTLKVVSALQWVTLSNTSASALNFAGTAVSIAGAADFAITGTTCGGTLLARTSCTVGLVFTPAALDSRSASLVFSDTAANSPQQVAPNRGSSRVRSKSS
jgi:hypothetical protein